MLLTFSCSQAILYDNEGKSMPNCLGILSFIIISVMAMYLQDLSGTMLCFYYFKFVQNRLCYDVCGAAFDVTLG